MYMAGIVPAMPSVGSASGILGIVQTPGNIQTTPAAPSPKMAGAATTARGLNPLPNQPRSPDAAQATASSTAAPLMSISKASPSTVIPLIHAYSTASSASPTGGVQASHHDRLAPEAAASAKIQGARVPSSTCLLIACQWGGIQIHVGEGPANFTDFTIVASSIPSGRR